jgi:hypothetical protein
MKKIIGGLVLVLVLATGTGAFEVETFPRDGRSLTLREWQKFPQDVKAWMVVAALDAMLNAGWTCAAGPGKDAQQVFGLPPGGWAVAGYYHSLMRVGTQVPASLDEPWVAHLVPGLILNGCDYPGKVKKR